MDDWYSARLLFECLPAKVYPKAYPWYEERIIVFRANVRETLPAKITELAKGQETEYEAADGTVRWVFREVLEVQDISTNKGIVDGTEVYFRWWQKPSQRTMKLIRQTHEQPWWLEKDVKAKTTGD